MQPCGICIFLLQITAYLCRKLQNLYVLLQDVWRRRTAILLHTAQFALSSRYLKIMKVC